MAPVTRQQANMSANNTQDTTQSSPIREPPEPTSPPPHEEEWPITRQEVRAIAAQAAEDAVMNILHRLNLLPMTTPEPYAEPPPQPISTTSMQPILTPSHPTVTPTATTPTPTSATTLVPHTRTEIIKPKDIGYFDPKPYAESTVSDSEHGPTIHDVYLFVNRLKEIASRTPNKPIPVELSLRGIAMEWFHSELSPSERSKLHSISVWTEALTRRFGPTTAEAMTAISNEHYTRNDAANRREPAGYIQAIIRHGNAAALPTRSTLALAYQNVDPELRCDLNDPTDASVSSFIKDMESKKPIWFDLYARRQPTPYSTNQPPRYRPPNPPYQASNPPRNNHPPNAPYPTNQPPYQPPYQSPYQYGRDTRYEPRQHRSYQAPNTTRNGSVDKPQAYNAAVNDTANNNYDNYDENDAETYYYDPPNDSYKTVLKCPRCRFHFDTYDKLVEHMEREGHKA